MDDAKKKITIDIKNLRQNSLVFLTAKIIPQMIEQSVLDLVATVSIATTDDGCVLAPCDRHPFVEWL